MTPSVDALLPLSLLHAVRSVDTPDDDVEAEYTLDLRNKRLGLSETVYAQIRRYTEASKKSERTGTAEAVALAKLIGRRPDAEEVFREAGQHLAREAYRTIPIVTRKMIRAMPNVIARPVAFRRARRIAKRYLNGGMRRVGSSVFLVVPQPLMLDEGIGPRGCVFYESVLRELLHLLVLASGAVEHVRCASRGDGECEWKAEWGETERETGNGKRET
jgi:predicted hydrocarbon binding protein